VGASSFLHRAIACAALGVVGLAPTSVHAQQGAEVSGAEPTRDTQANAIQFYERAQALASAGNYAEACPLYEESLRLDFGLGTLLYLSDCQEQIGKTASAWAGFKEAADLAANRGEKDRSVAASKRAAKLEPLLSYVKLELAPEHANIGTILKRNGQPIKGFTEIGTLAVDPGQQEFLAEAPGYKPLTVKVEVPKGPATVTVAIPALERAPVQVVPDAPSAIDGRAMKIGGVVAAGTGLVGLAVGTGFGIDAIKTYDAALATCENEVPTACTPSGVVLQGDASRSALVSTVSFVIGGALLGGGALLYFLAPDEDTTTVGVTGLWLGDDGAFLAVGGAF
jgi:tetratricopeptide (TPR) repeat protein